MTKIRTIIVDDEPDACEGLQLLLEAHEDMLVIETCHNGKEAVEAINKLKPDMVFLDIQMPGLNGFQVLERLDPKHCPSVVFVTAYDEYALHAFEVHALDYLQKPFTDERFEDALRHVKQRLQQPENTRVSNWLKSEEKVEPLADKLRIKTSGKIFFLNYAEVFCLQGFDYYIKVHSADRFYLVRESLKQVLQRLPDQFVQVHKSSIINLDHLREMEPRARGTYEITLANGQRVLMSRNYRDQLSDFL